MVVSIQQHNASKRCDRSDDYWQALYDFSVVALVDRLCHLAISQCSASKIQFTVQEIEQLAASLIQQWTTNLDGGSIADYLTAVRCADVPTFADPPACELHPAKSPLALPENFPDEMPAALFQEGEAVQWIPVTDHAPTDTGTIIGRFLAYAHHQRDWGWKYLVWLNQPHSLVQMDTAWEDDLRTIDRSKGNESTSR